MGRRFHYPRRRTPGYSYTIDTLAEEIPAANYLLSRRTATRGRNHPGDPRAASITAFCRRIRHSGAGAQPGGEPALRIDGSNWRRIPGL